METIKICHGPEAGARTSAIARCIEVLLAMALVFTLYAFYDYSEAREHELEAQRQALAGLTETLEKRQGEKAGLLQALGEKTAQLAADRDRLAALKHEAAAMAEVLKWEVQTFEVTHYAPLDPAAIEGVCYSGDPRITASGAAVDIGTTAAAAPGIPFGTRLYIPGYGFRVVQDRGGDITAGRLDIAVANKTEAFQLGRKRLSVYIEERRNDNALH